MSIRTLHRNVKLRLGVGFVIRFLSFMLAPLMVIHFAALYGAATAGVMLFGSTCVAIASTIFGGHLSDVHGRRPVLLFSDGGIMAGYLLMAVANSSWLHLSADRAGIGQYAGYMVITAMGGLAYPATDAMMIDVATQETRLTIYTLNYWSLNLAFSCGAIVGAFLYSSHFRLLLLGAALLSAAVFAVTLTSLAETKPADARGTPPGKGPKALVTGYRVVWRDALFARILLAATLVRSVEAQITYYLAVRIATHVHTQQLLHFGTWSFTVDGVQLLGLLRTLNTVMVVCLALFVRKLLKGVSDRVRLLLGIGLYTAGFMVLAVSNTGWVLLSAAVVYTVGELMNGPMRQLLVSDFAVPESRTRYMAAYSMQVRVGLLIASLCVSLSTLISPAGMAGLYAVLGGSSMVLYGGLFRHRAARMSTYSTEGTPEERLALAAKTDPRKYGWIVPAGRHRRPRRAPRQPATPAAAADLAEARAPVPAHTQPELPAGAVLRVRTQAAPPWGARATVPPPDAPDVPSPRQETRASASGGSPARSPFHGTSGAHTWEARPATQRGWHTQARASE